MSSNSIALEAPLVAGELESYTEGKSRRITVKWINEYIERRLAAEAARRGRSASDRDY
jgi:hypothetical protein